MPRLPGRHAPVMLALLLCTGALSLPLTGTIVGGSRGGRAWLCHRRGAAVGLPVPGLLPDSGTIDQAGHPRGCSRVGGQLLFLPLFPLSLLLLLFFLDAAVPARTVVVGLVPAFGCCGAVVLCMDLKVALSSRDEEKHGEFRERQWG